MFDQNYDTTLQNYMYAGLDEEHAMTAKLSLSCIHFTYENPFRVYVYNAINPYAPLSTHIYVFLILHRKRMETKRNTRVTMPVSACENPFNRF